MPLPDGFVRRRAVGTWPHNDIWSCLCHTWLWEPLISPPKPISFLSGVPVKDLWLILQLDNFPYSLLCTSCLSFPPVFLSVEMIYLTVIRFYSWNLISLLNYFILRTLPCGSCPIVGMPAFSLLTLWKCWLSPASQARKTNRWLSGRFISFTLRLPVCEAHLYGLVEAETEESLLICSLSEPAATRP